MSKAERVLFVQLPPKTTYATFFFRFPLGKLRVGLFARQAIYERTPTFGTARVKHLIILGLPKTVATVAVWKDIKQHPSSPPFRDGGDQFPPPPLPRQLRLN